MCTRIVGRNADWNDMAAKVDLWLFPRGLKRDGGVGKDPVKWTSKLGAVITGFYDNVSADGMNEVGLICNLLYQVQANYGDPNQTGRPTLSIGAWLQSVLFTPSWNKVSKEQIIPDALLETIQHGGRPEIYLKDFVGREFLHSFPDIAGLTNRYHWDIVFPHGDIHKAGVGGQGIYISPSADVVVVWFSTGKQEEEILARAIVKSIGAAN